MRAAAGLALCLLPGAAQAADTQIAGFDVSLDTTLSSSVLLRTSEIDAHFVGRPNGGLYSGSNADNGTLNFAPGTPVGAVQRVTTELQARRDDYGIFLRATGFYDPVIDSERTDFMPLSRAAVRDIGADLRLLDAYAFFRPALFGHDFDIRIGSQPLNWGESTFIPFGINAITPLDVTALRVPGSELKQAFLPVPAADIRTELGAGLSLEAFWQFAWTRFRLEPDGSFFSTNDTIFDGGRYANLRADTPDAYRSIFLVNQAAGNAFGAGFPRSLDRHPTTLDEFGVALRWTATSLADTEFGLYFENYHSRTPFGSYRTGNDNISGLPGALAPLPDPLSALLAGGTALRAYNGTSSYFADYPKDIHLLGLSFSTAGPAGIALQGEISHRFNQPIQLATSDLALANTLPALRVAQSLSPQIASAYAQALSDPVIRTAGYAGFDQIIDGWKRYPVTQAQITATRLTGPIPALAVASLTLVGEAGFDYVHDFPRDRGLFNAYYATDNNSATTRAATVDGQSPFARKGLASQVSGAAIGEAVADMPGLLPWGIDMQPTIALRYDFLGTSPIGVNVFQQNTAAASIGVSLTYLQKISFTMQYTNHFPVFGPGKFYGLLDRDFVSATLTTSF